MIDVEFVISAPEDAVLARIQEMPVGTLGNDRDLLVAGIGRGSNEIVTAILKIGVHPDLTIAGQWTPIRVAIEDGYVDIVKTLINFGADVNYGGESGYTPLQHAVDMEADTAWQMGNSPQPTITKLLIEAGADPDFKNDHGQSARDIARDYDYHAALALMPEPA